MEPEVPSQGKKKSSQSSSSQTSKKNATPVVAMETDNDDGVVTIGKAINVTPTMTDTRRLMITKIVMENFKSYAGVQEVGPFHKCFSSVVGPNGSGKSNVIEAMLFVFGFNAKQIRQNKLGELVHNSQDKKNLTNAQVSVYFQEIQDLPGEDYRVIEGSEFVVSRNINKKFKKDGSGYTATSQYHLNGKQTTLDDLRPILKGKGIDLENNRFLILQGEVESIAMMKPKSQGHDEGLLDYLEEIIGSRRFVEAIDRTGKDIEDSNEKRTEKLNRLKIVEKEKDALVEGKDQAMQFINTENECNEQKSIYYQIARSEPEREKEKLLKQKVKLDEQLKKDRSVYEDSKKQLKEHESHLKQETKIFDELNKDATKAKNDLSALEKKAIKYKEEIKHLKVKIQKNNTVLTDEQSRQEEYQQTQAQCQKDIKRWEKESQVMPKKLVDEEKQLETMLSSLKGEVQQLQQQMETKQKELMPFSKKHSECKSKVDIQTSELDVLSRGVNDSTQNLESATQALEEAKKIMQTSQADINKAKKESEVLASKIKESTTQLNGIVKKEEKLYSESLELRSKTQEIKSSLNENSSRSTMINRLMELKDGKLPGIHGRLGDLGAIDSKYDVAISTACGALDNIVVDSTATAEACVEVLRKENLGRGTFIILDKIEYMRKHIGSIKTPENVPRLFDLIKMKNKDLYSTAFYYGLQNTLVADNLDQATRIAYGQTRYRVVTLEGALVDLNGSMSGGGNRVNRGGMSSRISVDPREEKKKLQELEIKLSANEEELKQCKKEKMDLELQIQQQQQRKSELELQIPKMEMNLKAAGKKQEELSKAIPELKQQVKLASENNKQIQKIRDALAIDQQELDKVQIKVDRLEGEISQIQNQIINIGGEKVKAQKEKVDALQLAIDGHQRNITKANVQIQSMEKSIDRSKKIATENEKELEENQEELKKIEGKIQNLKEETKKSKQEVTEKQQLVDEKQEQLDELKKEYQQHKAVVDKHKVGEVDINNQIEDLLKAIQVKTDESQSWIRKYEKLNSQRNANKILEDDPDIDPYPILTDDQINEYMVRKNEIRARIQNLERDVENLKGSININTIKEYKRKERDYNNKLAEYEQEHAHREELKKKYDELRRRRLDEFMAGFSIITQKLKEMYQMITMGGDAELELVDTMDPFSEGIVFSVRPPKKSWKNINNLSGGEKTLSSLSLVFALHHYKPTALYVMDEIDAALDFRNVSIIANYIKERTKNAQFIIISLRNDMFELADRLVGIYKTDNCTKSITINPSSFTIDTNNNNNGTNKNSQKNK
ncbi:structural maintenance of chromosome protein [Tieghemostelium lacteum]|uniref:Structural maintenance of chromosomes protein n=1 Tax=Tieghemostelium lacteum TaxID=361077 RepID=A0A152A222_TIELA|nr:structural maintenance of chromosome protein [Tieghemostelium lacteum]|eukprot:KYR00167.1 structural maintenance of chromosome protein [Tieghemostelium lacteum]